MQSRHELLMHKFKSSFIKIVYCSTRIFVLDVNVSTNDNCLNLCICIECSRIFVQSGFNSFVPIDHFNTTSGYNFDVYFSLKSLCLLTSSLTLHFIHLLTTATFVRSQPSSKCFFYSKKIKLIVTVGFFFVVLRLGFEVMTSHSILGLVAFS